MSAKSPEPTLTLSQEELYFLLVLLKSRRIPGMEGIFDVDASDSERTHLLDAARRALVARGLVTLQVDGRATMDEFTLAVIGTCVRPLFSVMMENTALDRSSGVFWHGITGLIVEHTLPQQGIHRFRALPAGTDLVSLIVGAAEVYPSETNLPLAEVRLMEEAFARARKASRDEADEEAARVALVQGGAPGGEAEKLAALLAQAETSTTVAFARRSYPEGGEELFGGTALSGPGGAILTVPTGTGSGEVRVRPLSRQDWRSWLEMMLEVVQASE